MSVLQEGRARRRHGRRRHSSRRRRPGPYTSPTRRRIEEAFAVLFLSAVALLVVMASQAAGPPKPAPKAPLVHHAAAPKAPVRGDYGIAPAPAAQRVTVNLQLPLKSGLLFNVTNGQVLWARNPTDVVPIASLTKMMTALLVVTHSRAPGTDKVLITHDALNYTGSGVGLLPLGKRVPLVALLYGLLLPSGNDAAIALADHVAGTQTRFIALMNAKAHALGLKCTHYTTVSGIVDQGNHSCAEDLALLAHLVLEQPLLAKIVSSPSAVLPFPIKGGKLFLYNNNPLLVTGYPGTDGVKTGFTDAAGECLVATARRGRTWLGVVLLNSGNTGAQAEQLLNIGFAKLSHS